MRTQRRMHGRYYAGRMLNVEFCTISWKSAICGRSHAQPGMVFDDFTRSMRVVKESPDEWAQRFVSFQNNLSMNIEFPHFMMFSLKIFQVLTKNINLNYPKTIKT